MAEASTATTSPVLARREGRVLVITLNRPDKRNAMNDPTVKEIGRLFATLESDVAAVVITTSGVHFSAGLDLSELTVRDLPESIMHSRGWHAVFETIQFGRVPVIAALKGAVIGGGDDGPPPARIVLMSDGKETVPSNPDNPKGAFTAARTAKDQGVPISTVSFGTPYGYVEINDQRQPVPVDEDMLSKIAELSDGNHYSASNLQQLKEVFSSLQDQIGYETVKGDASVGWLRLGAATLALAALAALLINRRLPG
jgi:hypothetical protein